MLLEKSPLKQIWIYSNCPFRCSVKKWVCQNKMLIYALFPPAPDTFTGIDILHLFFYCTVFLHPVELTISILVKTEVVYNKFLVFMLVCISEEICFVIA